MSINQNFKHILLVTGALLIGTATLSATTVSYAVTLNTSSLENQGQFSLAFQLASGTGLDNGSNTVSLYNFSFGGGTTAGSIADLNGGASGSFASGVSITDNFFFNEMDQSFTPGSSLSFWITLSNNANAGASPDLFTISLLNGTGFGVPTKDPSGNDTLMTIALNGSLAPSVGTWGTDTSQTSYNVPAPTFSSVPEPGSLLLLGSGFAGCFLLRIRRAKNV